MKKYLAILLFSISFLSCEKDDICDSSNVTTPQVVITFYDKVATDTKKNVVNLSVNAPSFSALNFSNVSTIKIPLQMAQDATAFQLIKNGADNDATNDVIDELNFNYIRENIFVSRACGYKTIFNLTNTNSSLVILDGTDWIDHVEIVQPKIETENETHIKVYF